MAMQCLLCICCCAIFAEPTVGQPLPTSKSWERIALSDRGYAVFAMQSLLCNICRAYLEPSFANDQIIELKSIALSKRGYAVFAMQSLPCNLCPAYLAPTFAKNQIIGIHCSEQSWLCTLCYAIFAMQSLPSLP